MYFRIVDTMPVTWCYQIEGNQVFCSTGFPMGCYVNSVGLRKDACIMNVRIYFCFSFYSKFLSRHVDAYAVESSYKNITLTIFFSLMNII